MSENKPYLPPYIITSTILHLVGQISEEVGLYTALARGQWTPLLRRKNRIRTVHASLAIENNTLSLAQVTAVINGKRVLGHPREILEVRNAFAAYDAMESWECTSPDDLLAAHRVLMAGLVDEVGAFRSGGVGVFQGQDLLHMAPNASRVPKLMNDLLKWLRQTDEHPLVASCVFHYEFEFIHPFADGNGRVGRLWHTLILRKWKPMLAYLPVETVIRERQGDYYRVLAESDHQGNATGFVEFMLRAILDALKGSLSTDQVGDQVTDQVARLIQALVGAQLGSTDLMAKVGLVHRPTFRKNYLAPALAGGWIERCQPGSPSSPTQRYRLTEKGRHLSGFSSL